MMVPPIGRLLAALALLAHTAEGLHAHRPAPPPCGAARSRASRPAASWLASWPHGSQPATAAAAVAAASLLLAGSFLVTNGD